MLISGSPAAAEDPGMKSGATLWPLHLSSNSVCASLACRLDQYQPSGGKTGDDWKAARKQPSCTARECVYILYMALPMTFSFRNLSSNVSCYSAFNSRKSNCPGTVV
eukprot:3768118-Amphidinium_carterae.1